MSSAMNLSKYIIRTKDENGHGILFDSVQRKWTFDNADKSILEKNYFLEGQELLAIYNTLFNKKVQRLNLIVIPTWECNLSCKHCCVGHKLFKSNAKLSVDKLINFIKRYMQKYTPQKITINFCGGEPTLEIDIIKEIINKLKFTNIITFSLSTNLILLNFLDLMDKIDIIGISVDGDENFHNSQRQSNVISNPYRQTIHNIKQLILNGYRNKIHVKSSMNDYSLIDEYFTSMLKIGMPLERIHYNFSTPSVIKPEPSNQFLKILSSGNLKFSKCCKYRWMRNFMIDNTNMLHTDFYIADKLGFVDDDLEYLENRYKETIIKEMPILKDENCINCPSLGYCWGGCCQINFFQKNKPSAYCNKDYKLENIKKTLKKNKFFGDKI